MIETVAPARAEADALRSKFAALRRVAQTVGANVDDAVDNWRGEHIIVSQTPSSSVLRLERERRALQATASRLRRALHLTPIARDKDINGSGNADEGSSPVRHGEHSRIPRRTAVLQRDKNNAVSDDDRRRAERLQTLRAKLLSNGRR